MRDFTLQNSRINPTRSLILGVLVGLSLLLAGCDAPQVSQAEEQVNISISVDGTTQNYTVRAGTRVDEAIAAANILLGKEDEISPPNFTILSEGDAIKITRINTEDKLVQEPLPYPEQYVPYDYLPAGQQKVIQPGENGLVEYTIHSIYRDGVLAEQKKLNQTVLVEPVAQVIALGAKNPVTPIRIPGRLVYISSGNAWLVEESTDNRNLVTSTGDLDGRILTLSADGQWLLFTRRSKKPASEEINTLWVVNLAEENAKPINLKVSNVVHYAGFAPFQTNTIAYSTVEPRASAPGWQANNDLYFKKFQANGSSGQSAEIIAANAGGIYGWWGTTYQWAPDGRTLAYIRPDGVGLVKDYNKPDEARLEPLLDIVPLQTGSDWTLIPGFAFGADASNMYVVTHAPPPGLVRPEESPYFDLSAISLINSTNIALVQQSGMFAYPAASSLRKNGSEESYFVAYLQAIFPDQSDTSRYKLVVMDRDGSNRRVLFPPEGSTGLEPQTPVWAPSALSANEGDFLAVVYKNNLWLVDIATGKAYQITGEGLVTRLDW